MSDTKAEAALWHMHVLIPAGGRRRTRDLGEDWFEAVVEGNKEKKIMEQEKEILR